MTPESPLVSIGMPVFNEEKTITTALDSLLAQTYPNFEIIISDNCSTDKTAQICKVYAEKDKRIKLNLNRRNLGIIANFVTVHRKGSGEYFMWGGGDDYWEPEFLKTLVSELESYPAAGVAQSAVRRMNPDGSLKDIIRFDEKYNKSKFLHWQLALKLLSPRVETKSQKYNLFIYGLFRNKVVNDTFTLENDILKYKERAFLGIIALSHKFRYVDEILFSKTVQEPFRIRHPDDEYTTMKKGENYLTYWLKYYCRLTLCISKYSEIPLQRKFFVLFFLYWISWRFARKQKKRIRKLFYGKNAAA